MFLTVCQAIIQSIIQAAISGARIREFAPGKISCGTLRITIPVNKVYISLLIGIVILALTGSDSLHLGCCGLLVIRLNSSFVNFSVCVFSGFADFYI